MINSAANGNVYTMGWVNLGEGMNYLSLNATEHTRAIIGFETQGTFKFRSFSHQFSSQDAAWAIETISVAVPEPSTYSLVAGLLVFILISFKRRLIRN